jgi:hypothetical protein
MEIKSGQETIHITEQNNCLAIVHRKWDPYTERNIATPLFISHETFADMVRPLVEVARYISANNFVEAREQNAKLYKIAERAICLDRTTWEYPTKRKQLRIELDQLQEGAK